MSVANNAMEKSSIVEAKKQKRISHPFLALIVMILLVMAATYVIPAGEFARISDPATGRTIVDPTTFTELPKNPAKIQDFFISWYYGFTRVAGITAMVLFIGGTFGTLKRIGLLDSAVQKLTKSMQGKGILPMATIIMVAIGMNHGFTGFRELDMIFLPLLIPVCLSLGYDAMTAMGIVFVGSAAGFAAAPANPFFTGIAHTIAELPMYSAMGYRFMIMGFFMVTGIAYVVVYANKVKNDPTKSIIADGSADISEFELNVEEIEFTTQLKLAGAVFLVLFAFMIYGTLKMGFGYAQLSGIFVAMGIIPALIAGYSPNDVCYMFADGSKDMLTAAMIMLFARSILVIMENAQIIDSIIRFLAQFIEGTSTSVAAVGVYFLQTIINVVIPSGSGQATVTMPIVTPVADLSGISRQVACLASQLGDGLTNYVYPTNGILMAAIAVSKIPYTKWLRWFMPLFLVWSAAAAIFVATGQIIGLQ